MPTIYDLSRALGLGVSTVSKALNGYTDVSESTRRRVWQAAREMGFQPNSNAQALKTKRTHIIGVLNEDDGGSGLIHPHFGLILEHFKRTVEEHGYELMLMNHLSGKRHRSYLEQCRYRGFDGLMVLVANALDPGLKQLLEFSIPKVLVDFEFEQEPSVLADNVGGGEMAVDYLCRLGHRRIAHIAAPLSSVCGRERLEGYKHGLERQGLAWDERLVVEAKGFRVQDGQESMRRLLLRFPTEQRPTAVFANCDSLAYGIIDAARQAGLRVPAQLSVVGFDNLDNDMMMLTPLTTMDQHQPVLGRVAAEMLLSQMRGVTLVEPKRRLPVTLVERETCAPPPTI